MKERIHSHKVHAEDVVVVVTGAHGRIIQKLAGADRPTFVLFSQLLYYRYVWSTFEGLQKMCWMCMSDYTRSLRSKRRSTEQRGEYSIWMQKG